MDCFDGARERTRTSTTLRSLAPEASASASSATRARVLWVKPQPNQGYSSNEAFSLCPPLPALSTKGPRAADQVDVASPGRTGIAKNEAALRGSRLLRGLQHAAGEAFRASI